MAYPIIDSLAGLYISDQGRIVLADDTATAALFLPTPETMYYEVIRVVRGIPLFWEDHLARLGQSVQANVKVTASLYDDSCRLIAANGLQQANLRIVLLEGRAVIHLTPSAYPVAELFEQGVATGILAWEREDPNVKIINSDYKAAVALRYANPGPFGVFYELLLADRQGLLTEGSRSNLFLIRGNQVLSAPESRILKGITRQHVMEAIATAGATLAEEMLTFDDICRGRCDAAFLSSSPFDILPIRSIEAAQLDSTANPLLRKIDQAYRQIVENYIQDHSIIRRK